MNNDELVTRRAQAMPKTGVSRKDVCADEFRMKPAPGAEPVSGIKIVMVAGSLYTELADCVPMCEKRPLTSKQQLAASGFPFYPD
ncbi:YacC [Escherichia coli]|nr:YacC [Escherichia coli]